MEKKTVYNTKARSVDSLIRNLREIRADFPQDSYVVIDYIDFESEEFDNITTNYITITVHDE